RNGEGCPHWPMLAMLGGSSFTTKNARVWQLHFGEARSHERMHEYELVHTTRMLDQHQIGLKDK
ncbi:hypothetical protein Q6264_27920, partial [Klebsiella pneumoniae]|uniref:hypothetical protein n=1 Tax=Klebsiella pneumoniae TaxID=573 RepID=UPI002730302C